MVLNMDKYFRVLITDKCNMNCKTCFNKDIREKAEMSLEDFKELCVYLKTEGDVVRLRFMGGEPTVHPDFIEMVEFAQSQFKGVSVFTNAVNDKILSLNMRENDAIIYNVACMNENFDTNKFLLNQNFTRMLETQIDSKDDISEIKKKLLMCHNVLKDKANITLTLNCVENIFVNRDEIIKKWNDIANYITNDLKACYGIDHAIPLCMFYNTEMKNQSIRSSCSLLCSGLIAPDLKLRYCNQTPGVLLEIKQGGKFVPYKIIENYLQNRFNKKMSTHLDKICKDCPFFGKRCNGGCFIHKDFITREDILQNTNLPLK